ncbi:MAG TPA: hypothetical protein VHF47_12090 [Acidimicrobiales bacterium]|nr:hypothetical protein [Acidimicrobiales bacterium]
MKRVLALAVVCAVLVLGAGCSRDRLQPGEARLTFSGEVLLGERGKALKPVTEARRIHFGDRVKVVRGTAQIVTADGPVYELRESDFRLASSPTLSSGEVLVRSVPSRVRLQAAGSEVLVRGVARVERSLAVSTAVYQGSVVLESGGREFTVAALRQAAVPAIGVLPTAAAPVAYDADDEWDRRFLGAAMAFGRELEARSRAFGPNVVGDEGRTPGFYRVLLPELEREGAFDGALLTPGRPAGETLVGATLAVSSRKASFAERWRSVFGFRDEGAAWGLVALDQGVSSAPEPVLDRLDAAIGRAPLRFSSSTAVALGPQGPAVPTSTGTGSGSGTGSTGTGSTGSGAGGGSGGGSPTTTSTTQPPTTTPTTQPPRVVEPPDLGPGEPVTQPILDPVIDTLDGLLSP